MNLLGYCMNEQGEYDEPIQIVNLEEVSSFLRSNITKHYELRICDHDDMVVFQAIDQRLIFPLPEGGSADNKWNPESQKFESIHVTAKF